MKDAPPDSEARRETTPSLHPPSMGRVAFTAYALATMSHVLGRWDDLTDEERRAWEAAADAVCG